MPAFHTAFYFFLKWFDFADMRWFAWQVCATDLEGLKLRPSHHVVSSRRRRKSMGLMLEARQRDHLLMLPQHSFCVPGTDTVIKSTSSCTLFPKNMQKPKVELSSVETTEELENIWPAVLRELPQLQSHEMGKVSMSLSEETLCMLLGSSAQGTLGPREFLLPSLFAAGFLPSSG